MNYDNLEYIDESSSLVETDTNQPATRKSTKDGNRADPRCGLVTQAFVAIPSLASRLYEVREVSRGGIFLAFKEPVTTLLEMEKADIGVGANAEIAFAVSTGDQRHRINVRARIARITREGIGLQFLTHNPPQLAALRELFSHTGDEVGREAPKPKVEARHERRRPIHKPADDSAWQDWELLD